MTLNVLIKTNSVVAHLFVEPGSHSQACADLECSAALLEL